jgi:hypothetical protein
MKLENSPADAHAAEVNELEPRWKVNPTICSMAVRTTATVVGTILMTAIFVACGSGDDQDTLASDPTDVRDATSADGEADAPAELDAPTEPDASEDTGDVTTAPDSDVASDIDGGSDVDRDSESDTDTLPGPDTTDLSPCELNPCANTDNPCLMNVCNTDTGLCELVPPLTTDVLPCDDDDPCTSGDVCETGVCEGTAVDCSGLDSTCGDGACNAETGECEAINPRNEGSPCDGELDPCGTETLCVAGYCDSITYACTPSWVEMGEALATTVDNISEAADTELRAFSCPDGQILADINFFTDTLGSGTLEARYVCGTPIASRQSYAPELHYRELRFANTSDEGGAGRTIIEPCADLSAITGIAVILSDSNEYIGFQGLCSAGAFNDERPADWELAFETPVPPDADGLTDSVEVYSCGAGEVVVGFALRNDGADVVGINVECAPADVVLARGGAEPIIGEPNAEDMDVCPIGTVAVGVSHLIAADREFFMPTDARLRCAIIQPQTSPPMLATLVVEDNDQPGRGTAAPTNPNRINAQCADDLFLTGMRVTEFVDGTTGEAALGGAEFECRGYDIEVDPVLLSLAGISLSSDAPELATLLRTVDRGADWLRCPDGEYLVGIYSQSDELLNTVAPLCSRMQVSFFNGTR